MPHTWLSVRAGRAPGPVSPCGTGRNGHYNTCLFQIGWTPPQSGTPCSIQIPRPPDACGDMEDPPPPRPPGPRLQAHANLGGVPLSGCSRGSQPRGYVRLHMQEPVRGRSMHIRLGQGDAVTKSIRPARPDKVIWNLRGSGRNGGRALPTHHYLSIDVV